MTSQASQIPKPPQGWRANKCWRQCEFITSAAKLSQCVEDTGGEIAFSGRSNAGKSSLLNALTDHGKMAKVSKTPGRTQLINFFKLNSEHYRLVDLPGYGFAKVSISMKEKWQKSLTEYLERRESLKGLIVLMDIRHPLQPVDNMLIEWSVQYDIPCLVVLTKADKLKSGARKQALLNISQTLSKHDNIRVTTASSLKKDGLDAIRFWGEATLDLPDIILPPQEENQTPAAPH